MSIVKTLLFGVTVAITAVLVYGQKDNITVTENCLGCLCEALTKCRETTGPCLVDEGCGPYFITHQFWVDAGKPVLEGDDPDTRSGYENCVLNLFCAAETVRKIMKNSPIDCNGDGVVNCADYARIHKYGVPGCASPIIGTFKKEFEDCCCRLNEF